LKQLGLVDVVIDEPIGGAHRQPEQAAANLKKALLEQLNAYKTQPVDKLVEARYQRYMGYGQFDVA
jgi:acetyl-CoA carboxylase carboxyl transferase subunit alpha